MELKFQVQTKISKPVGEVFDAVVNPDKLSGYFTKSATPMREGEKAIWHFHEVPGDYPVLIRQIVPNELIVFEWDSEGTMTRVEMRFESIDQNSTMLKISESGFRDTEDGLKYSYGNCQGWTEMALCLKAFVQYGINLRP